MQAYEIMTQDFISIDQNDVISKLLGRFITKKQKEAIVVDGNKYLGIVSKKSMLNSRMKADEVKIKKFIKRVSKINKNYDLKKVCEQMVSSDTHILPILYEDRRIEGALLAKDVIAAKIKHAKGYKVKDIERTQLTTFDYLTAVGKVINTLRHSKISHIPVTDLKNKLVGVVSTIDILEKFSIFPAKRFGGKNIRQNLSSSMKERDLMKLPLQNYMSKNVETVNEDDELEEAIDIMLNRSLSDVIITKDNIPIGIITVKDVLRLFSVV